MAVSSFLVKQQRLPTARSCRGILRLELLWITFL
jgi:hypothetical protein